MNTQKTLMQERIERFDRIISNFENIKITDLICEHKIEKSLFLKLQTACEQYFKICKENEFINMTPNGYLVPKKEIEDLYTDVVVSFRDVVSSLNISSLIERWVLPVVRYKVGEGIDIGNKNRPSRSELPHADSWVGWDKSCVLILIPLLGDVKNNTISFFDMPANISEDWLDPYPFQEAQEKFVTQCKKIDFSINIGSLYLADISVVHQTDRKIGAKGRLSIDIPLFINSIDLGNDYFGKDSTLSPNEIESIGVTNKISCEQNMGEIMDGKNRSMTFKLIAIDA